MANVSESGESKQTRLANVGESGESGTFPKKAILASTQICQKWQISGEYSNSINSLSSGHCLIILPVFRRSKVENNVFLTYDLLKNLLATSAIRGEGSFA